MLDIELFCEMAAAWETAWKGRGATTRLDRSPPDGRSKSSAWLSIESGNAAGELIVWDSGEAEFAYVAGHGSELIQQHLEGLNDADIVDLLARLDEVLHTS